MIAPEHLRQHDHIWVVQKDRKILAALEYSQAEDAFTIVLPGSGVLGAREDWRIKLTPRLLELIELQPDGTLHFNF